MRKPVLVVSPIPSHPQDQGNSARIFRLARMFQLAGHPVFFVYFGLEGLSAAQASAKRECWDAFFYIQPQGPAPSPSMHDHYHVDDWYDERVGELVRELCSRWDFALCLVNYVWFSKVLEAVPEKVLKVIDTHDIFGDRHIVARVAGLEPAWFYTSKALEAMALRRADVIIAIQDEEEAYFRDLASVPVITIGYVIPGHPLRERVSRPGERMRIGYLGSSNPFNVESIRRFQDALEKHRRAIERYEFHLAGAVCDVFESENRLFTPRGRVSQVGEFYQDMDFLVNPMVGGTGLKIKSVEALAFGRPLLATWDAMVGICDRGTAGLYESPEDIAAALASEGVGFVAREILAEYNRKNVANFWMLVAMSANNASGGAAKSGPRLPPEPLAGPAPEVLAGAAGEDGGARRGALVNVDEAAIGNVPRSRRGFAQENRGKSETGDE